MILQHGPEQPLLYRDYVRRGQPATFSEAAAAGIAQMRDEGWMGALGPSVVIRVEVQLASVVHEVTVSGLARWPNGPSVSPKQELLNRPLRPSVR